MADPLRLIAYGNTWNPCLIILRDKGFQLEAVNGEDSMTWFACKDKDFYQATTPPELLGLVVLGETFGNSWARTEPQVLDEVLEAAFPDTPDERTDGGRS